MNVLALDLGTKTGWAENCAGAGNLFAAGTWQLATAKEITEFGKSRMSRRCDPRVCRLYEKLDFICDSTPPDFIVFEDVQFVTTTMQVQLWASFRTVAWLIGCQFPFIGVECVPVATLKKFATGSGSADKQAMRKHLVFQHPEIFSIGFDDNAVDACWLFLWAQHNLGRTLT